MTTLSKPKFNERCRIWNATHYQCLPNVFLIGASKSGTTSLYTHLMRHPNIDGVHRPLSRAHQRQNEVHRFDAPSFQNSVKDVRATLLSSLIFLRFSWSYLSSGLAPRL